MVLFLLSLLRDSALKVVVNRQFGGEVPGSSTSHSISVSSSECTRANWDSTENPVCLNKYFQLPDQKNLKSLLQTNVPDLHSLLVLEVPRQ